jgi:hypothetical protein
MNLNTHLYLKTRFSILGNLPPVPHTFNGLVLRHRGFIDIQSYIHT